MLDKASLEAQVKEQREKEIQDLAVFLLLKLDERINRSNSIIKNCEDRKSKIFELAQNSDLDGLRDFQEPQSSNSGGWIGTSNR